MILIVLIKVIEALVALVEVVVEVVVVVVVMVGTPGHLAGQIHIFEKSPAPERLKLNDISSRTSGQLSLSAFQFNNTGCVILNKPLLLLRLLI